MVDTPAVLTLANGFYGTPQAVSGYLNTAKVEPDQVGAQALTCLGASLGDFKVSGDQGKKVRRNGAQNDIAGLWRGFEVCGARKLARAKLLHRFSIPHSCCGELTPVNIAMSTGVNIRL